MERAPNADRTFYPDTPTHECDELSGNREPETCPPIAACHRTIGLHKRLKDCLLLCGRNANSSIGNGHVQRTRVDQIMGWCGGLAVRPLIQGNTEDHFALRGKFDGVADEINNDLPQTPHITYQPIRDIGVHLVDEFESLAVCWDSKRFHGL